MNLVSLQQQQQQFKNSPLIRAGSSSPVVKRGYSYEAQVGGVLEAFSKQTGLVLLNHPWLEHDGWHQPDFLLLSSQSAIVLEAKLTYTEDGVEQLERYKRVLEKEYKHVTRVMVCKNLQRGCPAPIEDLCDAVDNSIWHLYL